MTLSVCPAAVVAAPVEVAWNILEQPEHYGEWIDGEITRVEPPGPAQVGQTIEVSARGLGRTWHPVFRVELVDAATHQLGLYVTFPLGLRLRERLSLAAVDATTCRVQYG
jgi:Polyketide cyclase / dehydrase and lipid transport